MYRNAETAYLAGGPEADFRTVTQMLLDAMAEKESEATQAA
jgi:hypothetical protein